MTLAMQLGYEVISADVCSYKFASMYVQVALRRLTKLQSGKLRMQMPTMQAT